MFQMKILSFSTFTSIIKDLFIKKSITLMVNQFYMFFNVKIYILLKKMKLLVENYPWYYMILSNLNIESNIRFIFKQCISMRFHLIRSLLY